MNEGAGFKSKISRKLHSFSYYGSVNYPIADKGAVFYEFYKKW